MLELYRAGVKTDGIFNYRLFVLHKRFITYTIHLQDYNLFDNFIHSALLQAGIIISGYNFRILGRTIEWQRPEWVDAESQRI